MSQCSVLVAFSYKPRVMLIIALRKELSLGHNDPIILEGFLPPLGIEQESLKERGGR